MSLLTVRPAALALASAALLLAAFPNLNQPWCAWIALVPWLALLTQTASRPAFWWSWGIGLVFFLGSMWWLSHVTVLGWIVLCGYLALFFGCFGWLAARLHPPVFSVRLLVVPAIWVALEYARSHLLSGVGWNLLAYSQAPWRLVIQLADITGAWGVSFLLVLVNTVLAGLLQAIARDAGRSLDSPAALSRTQETGSLGTPPAAFVSRAGDRKSRWRSARLSAGVAAGALLLALGYGARRLPQVDTGPRVRIALVQGSIPQQEKWDELYRARNTERYAALTEAALTTRPDLIVWPETSVPGYVTIDEDLTQWVIGVAQRARAPLLVGAPIPTIVNGFVELRNSALLIDPAGIIRQRHDKLHLVPFGEFLPFERLMPWLRTLAPTVGDFTSGQAYTVFSIPIRNSEFGAQRSHSAVRSPQSELKFSVLICFEDVFPELARRFVREGARLLLVITNDAWFGATAAAYQHAQASTFRAVESRVPLARAANTGWSGCIDASGRWIGSVHGANGRELFVEGTLTCELALGVTDTVYLRWGDWFALLCLLGSGTWAGWWCARARGANRSRA